MSSRDGASVRGGDFGSLTRARHGCRRRRRGRRQRPGRRRAPRRRASTCRRPAGERPRSTRPPSASSPRRSPAPTASWPRRHASCSTSSASTRRAVAVEPDAADAEVLARVEAELGSDWAKLTAPAFDAGARPCCSTTAGPAPARTSPAWPPARPSTPRASSVPARPSRRRPPGGRRTSTTPRCRLASTRSPPTRCRSAAGQWADEVAVVTGASKGSIAAGVVGQLLAGGATVVATTSRLDPASSAFFKELYRDATPINGAALWVVPANMASFADVDALSSWISTEQTQTRAGATTVLKPAMTPTLLFPFAAGRGRRRPARRRQPHRDRHAHPAVVGRAPDRRAVGTRPGPRHRRHAARRPAGLAQPRDVRRRRRLRRGQGRARRAGHALVGRAHLGRAGHPAPTRSSAGCAAPG